MIKFIKDTLQVNGRWSLKRCLSVLLTHFVAIYVILPIWFPKFQVLEFVVASFLTFVGALIGMNVYQKLTELKNKTEE